MLLDTVKSQMMEALKKGDANRVETLRFLIAAVRNAAINKYGAAGEAPVTDADVLEIVKKQVKTHRESIDAFERAKRIDLVKKEREQLAVLEEFSPKELSDDELKRMLTPIASADEPNFGKLMGAAMKAVDGQADGSRVSAMLKSLKSAV